MLTLSGTYPCPYRPNHNSRVRCEGFEKVIYCFGIIVVDRHSFRDFDPLAHRLLVLVL